MSNNAYFKIGDTFSVPAQFYDTETKLGVPISPSMVLAARVTNKMGTLIADCVVTPYADQVADAGWFLISVADTTTWPVGEAMFDIKITNNSSIKHSMNECFRIIKGITP